MSGCTQCGMWVDPKKPYHPYAACLMFMGCKNGNTVQANLDAVVAKGAQYDSGFDDMADRIRELEATAVRSAQMAADDLLHITALAKRVTELEAALRESANYVPMGIKARIGVLLAKVTPSEAPTNPANSIHVGSDMHTSGAEIKIDPNEGEAHFTQPSTAETGKES